MLPLRTLGKTQQHVTLLGLGGEGILRTTGREDEARAVIQQALDEGMTYFDTAPAYAQSRDYLGSVFGSMKKRRQDIFIASKTHARDYAGSMDLLQDTLRRLKTAYIDLWQLHDLRTKEDIDAIFSNSGAIHALLEAQQAGQVKFIGITGHHDPAILISAMQKHSFDTVLLCVNAGDKHYLPFITSVIPEARKRNMGVIAMKTTAQTRLFPTLTPQEALYYAWSQDVDLSIVGCTTPAEVAENAALARHFKTLTQQEQDVIEQKTKKCVFEANYFKK